MRNAGGWFAAAGKLDVHLLYRLTTVDGKILA